MINPDLIGATLFVAACIGSFVLVWRNKLHLGVWIVIGLVASFGLQIIGAGQ